MSSTPQLPEKWQVVQMYAEGVRDFIGVLFDIAWKGGGLVALVWVGKNAASLLVEWINDKRHEISERAKAKHAKTKKEEEAHLKAADKARDKRLEAAKRMKNGMNAAGAATTGLGDPTEFIDMMATSATLDARGVGSGYSTSSEFAESSNKAVQRRKGKKDDEEKQLKNVSSTKHRHAPTVTK